MLNPRPPDGVIILRPELNKLRFMAIVRWGWVPAAPLPGCEAPAHRPQAVHLEGGAIERIKPMVQKATENSIRLHNPASGVSHYLKVRLCPAYGIRLTLGLPRA